MKNGSENTSSLNSIRKKLLSLSMQSTRKSYFPLLQQQLKASQENEERLKLLINSLPVRLSYVSADEKYVLVNNEYRHMFGIEPDEILGKHVKEVAGAENYRRAKPYIEQVLLGEQIQFELNLLNVHGVELCSEMTYVPDIHPVRGVQGFYVLAIDLTDKKRVEIERKSLEKKLLQAQKLESLGTLAGGIAHDFNNILSPLLGYAELLQSDMDADSELQEYVSVILQSTYRAKELVKQILTFSRSGESEEKPIRLQSMIKEALKLLRSSIPTSIKIQESIDPNCGIVFADPTQIHQIVMNLATNAYHAMESDGGTMKITLSQVSIDEPFHKQHLGLLPGEYAKLCVSDTGTGIPQDILDRIFDPYFTTKQKGKGTGLGLAIVQSIAHTCSGDVTITSKEGSGTTVTVYLPIQNQSRDNTEELLGFTMPGGSERILLIDDDIRVLKIQMIQLERLGYKVAALTSSVKALKQIAATPYEFDLIITDMAMPELSGTQLIQQVKEIRPGIPIIVCSGYADQIDIEKCRVLGIQDYIIKPAKTRELAETIRRVLS